MWPFKKRAPKAAADAVWSVGRGELNGAPLFVRVRSDPRPGLGRTDHTFRVGFAVPLRTPDSNGLPQGSEFDELARIEDLLVSVLEAGGESIQVLSITTGGMREFVFYTSDPDGVRAALPALQSQVRTHQLQSYVQPDPDWEVYRHFSL